MSRKFSAASAFLILALFACAAAFAWHQETDGQFLTYTVDPAKQHIAFYYKDNNCARFKSISRLKDWLMGNKQQLVFAINGGMFKPDGSPVGLFIDNKKVISPLDTTTAEGNFYLKPNGLFYLTTSSKAAVCKTEDFKNTGDVKYATQSGPMLVINGQIHPAFKQGSTNLNIRNGVGVLPDGRVLFVLSKTKISFYDLAAYLKNAGCKNALYLDGFVSRAYLPEKNWVQTDGDFGVMIGISKSAK